MIKFPHHVEKFYYFVHDSKGKAVHGFYMIIQNHYSVYSVCECYYQDMVIITTHLTWLIIKCDVCFKMQCY